MNFPQAWIASIQEWARGCPRGCRGMRKYLGLAWALALVSACLSSDAVATGEGKVPVTGSWGGAHVGLVLGPHGGSLEYDCASGEIAGPLAVDSEGRFANSGYHTPGQGGPVQEGYVPPRFPARYWGRIDGDTMTLHVRVDQRNIDIGPLTLRRNTEPGLFRCL